MAFVCKQTAVLVAHIYNIGVLTDISSYFFHFILYHMRELA